MSSYSDENRLGRQRAIHLIDECAATGNLPRLVQEIRLMVAEDSGIGVGFLFTIAAMAQRS